MDRKWLPQRQVCALTPGFYECDLILKKSLASVMVGRSLSEVIQHFMDSPKSNHKCPYERWGMWQRHRRSQVKVESETRVIWP